MSSRKGNWTCLSASCFEFADAALAAFTLLPGLPRATRAPRAAESPAPASSLPLTDIVCSARHACSPPRAVTCLSTTCSAVSLLLVVLLSAAISGGQSSTQAKVVKSRPLLRCRIARSRSNLIGRETADMIDLLDSTREGDELQDIRSRPRDGPDSLLINHQALRPELPDHHRDVVARLYQPSLVGERHPIGLSGLGRGTLAQLPDFLHRRNHQLDARSRSVERGLRFLVVEYFGLVRIQNAVREANEFARLHCLDRERVDAPDELVVLSCPSGEPIGLIVRSRRRGCRPVAGRCRSSCSSPGPALLRLGQRCRADKGDTREQQQRPLSRTYLKTTARPDFAAAVLRVPPAPVRSSRQTRACSRHFEMGSTQLSQDRFPVQSGPPTPSRGGCRKLHSHWTSPTCCPRTRHKLLCRSPHPTWPTPPRSAHRRICIRRTCAPARARLRWPCRRTSWDFP